MSAWLHGMGRKHANVNSHSFKTHTYVNYQKKKQIHMDPDESAATVMNSTVHDSQG